MSPTVLALAAPVDPSSLPSNAALNFYMHYVNVFDADIHAAAKQPTRFYSSKTVNYSANGSIIKGANALRTIIFVSDEEKGTHVVHAEAVTVCHLKGGKGTVAVPTSFVYTLAQAEEGAGEAGLQIWEIRSYLDLATVEKAKAMQGE